MAEQIDGVLVVAKEPGPTSHDIVGLVRRLTGVKRVGHGGTLDPFAAGVLPVFVGHATRLVEYHMGDGKEYRALVCFGARSTTDDLEGELTPSDQPAADTRARSRPAWPRSAARSSRCRPTIRRCASPAARPTSWRATARSPSCARRRVTISRLELDRLGRADAARPVATIEMGCSAGTYVRALARDLGDKLGSGAYLAALTRIASGPFTIEQAHPLDEVRAALTTGRARDVLLPMDAGLDFPEVQLNAAEVTHLARGQQLRRATDDGLVRVLDEAGRLVAIARVTNGTLQPEKVFGP